MSDVNPEVPSAKRIKLSKKDLEDLSKEELIERWTAREQWLDDALEAHQNEGQKENMELVSLRESEDKLRTQQLEATRRENLLVVRLAAKEQEMQEYANQIQELKQAQIPGSTQLRSTLLDPAVNLMFERMKRELNATKAKLEETQNELSAWKFTPDSNTGKRLMAKCRLLYQENEELGKMISSGRMAKLEGDLALQKNFSEEMKKSQAELDEFLLELDEDVEGMQSTILFLQQQLRESKEQIARLQSENQQLQASVNMTLQISTPAATRSRNEEMSTDINNFDDRRIVSTEQSASQESMEDACVPNHTPIREENGNSQLPSPPLALEENGGCSPSFKLDLEDSESEDSPVLVIHEETMTENAPTKTPVQEPSDIWTADCNRSPDSSKHSDILEVMETETPSMTTNTAEWVVIEKSDPMEGNGAPIEELVIVANGTDSISPTSNDET